MNSIELTLSREGERVRISASDEPKQTLKQYEDKNVSFNRINELCNEILSILNRANNRGDVADRLLVDLKKTGQELFDELLTEKVRQSLHSSSCDILSLDIDEQLIHVPWELLYTGEEFLCRKFSIGRTVSTRKNIPGSARRPRGTSLRMLVIADPDESLDAAYREGTRIRDELAGRDEIFKVDLVSSRVDTEYVKRNIRDYDIVHFSGHAEYAANDPSRSGWRMSDGIWSASDIRNIKGETPFPFLVFSNACHSGRTGQGNIHSGYEKEIYDLANTFLHCGVTHYIGTFLEVTDAPSSVFAMEFYEAFSRDVSVGEAVRTARERLIERYGESNIIWASYMLYGDPAYKIPYEKPQPVSASGRISKRYYAVALMIIAAASYYFIHHGTSRIEAPLTPPADKMASPLHVSFTHVIGVRKENGGAVHEILAEGSRLYIYDELHFSFASNRDAYYYLFTFDSSGRTASPFQARGSDTHDMTGEPGHVIKLDAHLFHFDGSPAIHSMYVLASETELGETEPVLWEIEKIDEGIKSGTQDTPLSIEGESDYRIVARMEIENGRVRSIE